MTKSERKEAVKAWAEEMLTSVPAAELDAEIEVKWIGAEFSEMMHCRLVLENMRDYPHMVYVLEDTMGQNRNATVAPTAVGKWIPDAASAFLAV